MTATRPYTSELRRDQMEATRLRILDAAAGLMDERGLEEVPNRRIAEAAGVTEMTVYRHFPSRAVLQEALWRRMNEVAGIRGGFPDALEEVVERLPGLFESFDGAPAHITSTITTATGRQMRASQDEARRKAFLSAVSSAAPELSPKERRKAAAVMQLIYSAHAWLSLREQWDLTGTDASDAAVWAARTLARDLQTRGPGPLNPTGRKRAG